MADTHSIIGTKNNKGQVYSNPRVMMNEAPRTPSFFTGSEVIKEAVRRANVDVMVAYPITPQSEAAALCGWSRHHASHGKFSDVGRRQVADPDDRHVPRHQFTALDSARHH